MRRRQQCTRWRWCRTTNTSTASDTGKFIEHTMEEEEEEALAAEVLEEGLVMTAIRGYYYSSIVTIRIRVI